MNLAVQQQILNSFNENRRNLPQSRQRSNSNSHSTLNEEQMNEILAVNQSNDNLLDNSSDQSPRDESERIREQRIQRFAQIQRAQRAQGNSNLGI